MPWSEWITPDVYEAQATVAPVSVVREDPALAGFPFVHVDEFDGDPNAIFGDVFTSSKDDGALGTVAREASIGEMWVYAGKRSVSNPQTRVESRLSNATYTANLNIDPLTARVWFPALLTELEYGVDYGVIPGKNELTDDDAYVQYEDTTNTLIGWQPWEVRLSVDHTTFAGGIAPPPALPQPAAAGLALGVGAALPTTADDLWRNDYYGSALWEAPVAEVLSNVGAGEWVEPLTLDLAAAVPASQTSFTAMLQPQVLHSDFSGWVLPNEPQDGGGDGDGWASSFRQFFALYHSDPARGLDPPSALYRFQMPRWRYWIPGELPLRQRQRDDGLALAPLRQRDRTSRQRSIRQRAYL